MANLASIARPYALAAFECARDKQQIAEWRSFLLAAAQVSREPTVQRLLADPERTSAELNRLFDDVLATILSKDQENFLKLLSQNRRLPALPEMVEAFNAHVAALENVVTARIITAVPAPKDFQQKIAKALTTRTQREVKLHCEVDPSILGGAIIHIGDSVIDGSVRGKLTRLLEYSLR
jgi:F-type H+-transporting ATPase subunit delta